MRKTSRNWKRAFAQSTYSTVTWNWFMILAAKSAEPVLVVSVLYASVKLLPIINFPPQLGCVRTENTRVNQKGLTGRLPSLSIKLPKREH